MSILEVVRAGAGSGKTYNLCETVAAAVAGGVDPARILATSFTKKAAAELKSRVQSRLLKNDDGKSAAHAQADRLELAAIGTVHGVAHQLLSRYAIEMGLSPRLEVITENVSDRAMSDLMGKIPEELWQPFAVCADRLGITDLNKRVLKLLAAKRGNVIGDDDFKTNMNTGAARVCELLAEDGPADVATSVDELYRLVDEALDAINALGPHSVKETLKGTKNLRKLRGKTIPLWGSYIEAGKITAGGGKKPGTPNAMLEPLKTHALGLRRNPALHQDILQFSSMLADATIRLDSQYEAWKSERGLVDFTDLEVLFLELLQEEGTFSQLSEDFDLILVDEFQDTNPLQLAIFEQLKSCSPRCRWVGDPKQAIYGFRGTDPALVNNIWDSTPKDSQQRLPDNYRSQKGLVQFVGELFAPVFGDDARQNPIHAAIPRGIERWVFDTKNQSNDAIALACGVAKLHSEGIRLGDIAVLERTNRLLKGVADAFDELGIPYLMESPGLLSTREAAMVLAGLRLVADRRDSLAAATVLHLLSDPEQETPDWVIERLIAIRSQDDETDVEQPRAKSKVPWQDDPRFTRLESIDRTRLSPLHIVQLVLEALELPRLVHCWGDPGRRNANLDSLIQHVQEYETTAEDNGQPATLGGLILCLEKLAADELDVRYPPMGHDAVVLTTYHAAKGLEWPVVILSGLHSDRDPDMWSPVVSGGGQAGDNPLHGRELRSWTWPFGKSDGPFSKRRQGSGLEDDALHAEEGRLQIRSEIEESLRLLYVGCTRAKQKLVFAHRTNQYSWLEQLESIDQKLDCGLGAGEHPMEGIDTSFVIRHLDAQMAEDCRLPANERERWLSLSPTEAAGEKPRFYSPSSAAAMATPPAVAVKNLPGQSYFPSAANESHYAPIGDAVHGYLAALPSLRSLDDDAKQKVAERCLAAYAVTSQLPATALVAAGERFCEWIHSEFPNATWHVEASVNGVRVEGGRWHGAIDLILQLPNGELIVVDHKSAPIRREHCERKATQYTGQLLAYREALEANQEVVRSTIIHFPLAGVIATVEI